MKESEIRKLFKVIQEAYSDKSFSPENQFKLLLWQDLLKDVPYPLAADNLRQYILNPKHEFPPKPGVLAAKRAAQAEGHYVPNAVETRLMLESQHVKQLADPGVDLEAIREKLGFRREKA